MKLINQLSSQLGRRDQQPNISLGTSIAKTRNEEVIREIQQLIRDANTSTEVLADLIKVTEAIGAFAPELIAHLYPEIKKCLNHKANHIVWRAMCVLAQISKFNRDQIFNELGRILQIVDQGSVITKDHGVVILIDLYEQENYRSKLIPLLHEQLIKAPDNQFGQYAEKWMAVIATNDIPELLKLVQDRLPDLVKDAHQKRAEKIILKLLKKVNR